MTFNRNQSIGATDAKRILAGDWLPLWREKTGRIEPDDLSEVFRVQLGKFTERFHLDWIQRHIGEIRAFSEGEGEAIVRNALHGIPMHVTRDGIVRNTGIGVEVKHSNSNKTLRELAEYYMPQLQHHMAVTGQGFVWFSAILGNDEPEPVPVDRDPEYIDALIEAEQRFWYHVTRDIEPADLGLKDPASIVTDARTPQVLVGGMTAPVDMSGRNEWAALASEYIELKPQADRCEAIKAEIKTLVPDTAPAAFGHGVKASRTKRGLTLTIVKGGDL